jgi:hypothetical protein
VLLAVLHHHAVDDVRRGRDQVQAELALQALPDDVQVQQPEETDAEAEAERGGRLGLVDQRGVVELELLQGVAELRVVGAVERVEPGEHHGPWVLVAAERLGRALGLRGDRVADLGLPHVLHAGDQVADLADAEPVGGQHLR